MKNYFLFAVLLAIIFTSCHCPDNQNSKMITQGSKIIGKPDIKLKSDLMTPEVLWSFGRIGEVVVSPDKKTIAFTATYYDIAENKGNAEIYTMGIDGKDQKKITESTKSEFNLQWRPDSKKIGFLYPAENGVQFWEMDPDGSNRTQISKIDGGVTGFIYSPDQKKVLYTRELGLVKKVADIYPDLPKANARIDSDLMYRHWDSYTESFSHIFIADYDGLKLSNDLDIMKDEKFDVPNKPFAGMEQIEWAADSKSLVYSCVKKSGKEYAVSTNSDIYQYNLDTKKTVNLTEGMLGYDNSPRISPDGKKMAWESMGRDGYESDKQRLFVMDLEKNTKTDFSKDFDQNSNGLVWSDDSKSLYFVSDWHATDEIYKLDLEGGKITKLTKGVHNYLSVIPAGDKLIATRQSMSKPTEIYLVNIADGKDTEISFVNKWLLDQIKTGEIKERWIKTTDNKQMQAWVIYPPDFNPLKKYPTLLFCEGGPQSTVSQFWSYRWNMQIMAANGYIIIAPNRRGLPGFGQEWLEQISGDYGGQNMKDYLSAIDDITKEPYVNKDKLGAVGASYGGYSVYYLAGIHNKRFKAFISHDGMFNLESQYLETEEMWFVNWDLGGPFWDKNNKIAQKSYEFSPHKLVQYWNTPIMVVHGGLDYRISYTQGMQAFNAAVLRGIPAKFLYFPEENHWVLKPQDGILWQREFFSWLNKWLK
jgi:dipeptidyl aminopeptidase/acylaminoacyl peptidase